jgi:Spondin_N.
MNSLKNLTLLVGIAVFSLLTACGGDGKDGGLEPTSEPTVEPMRSFTFQLINTTHAQPLSPPALVIHEQGSVAWEVGSPASFGLEVLAESGGTDGFIAETTALVSLAGTELILPGQSASYRLDVMDTNNLSLTLAAMLVNTNDAFTGVSDWALGALEVGGSREVLAPIYDAGTEVNSESSGSIPGPAAGGEGHNAIRDDVDFVARHSGVVTAADGLDDSALNQAHRFDNGALLISVTRTQ